jgi:protein-tyrosine phosphatase
MTPDRHLDWEGCCNARDLGGLPTTDGRVTRWGAVARSERLDELTAAGWSALAAHGIRTIVDLRNDDEREPLGDRRPAGIAVVHEPVDDRADTRFWDQWGHLDGTPLFFRPFLDAKPERCAAAVTAVANAGPGGVLVHCASGRDRTGLISVLLLALVGVVPDVIAEDYEVSTERLRPLYERMNAGHVSVPRPDKTVAEGGGDGAHRGYVTGVQGFGDVASRVAMRTAQHHTTVRQSVLDTLASLDVEATLKAGGLGDADLTALRARLLGRSDQGDASRSEL